MTLILTAYLCLSFHSRSPGLIHPHPTHSRDTVITYDISGMSSEGSEARVSYTNGKIAGSLWSIFGETGQISISYRFTNDSVRVDEKDYAYKTVFTHVKSDAKLRLTKHKTYSTDLEGKSRKKIGTGYVDENYLEFKKQVPFVLAR